MFFSHQLQPAEQRFITFDRELLAVCLAVRHFYHLLEGREYTVFTDHEPLTFTLQSKSANDIQAFGFHFTAYQ